MTGNFIQSAWNALFFWKKKSRAAHVQNIAVASSLSLSDAKQKKLEILCNQLFSKKELITSGKLQFIGLEKVRSHLGKKWPKLKKIVHGTAEAVIREHLAKGDVSIQYKDDTYVLIFARASLQEGQAKAALIAEEIRKRLFGLKEEILQDVKILEIITEIRTDTLIGRNLPEITEEIAVKNDAAAAEQRKTETGSWPEFKAVQVETFPARLPQAQEKHPQAPVTVTYAYIPLWDIGKNALATYLCIAQNPEKGGSDFEYHQSLFNHRKIAEKMALDIATLNVVAKAFETMEKEGKRLLIACPVQYDTLLNYDSHAEYKRQVSHLIPPDYQQYLELLVMNIPHAPMAQDAYWFVGPIRQVCRQVLAEVSLRRDTNFQQLYQAGFHTIGVRLRRHPGSSEQELISLLNSFGTRAKTLKVPHIFVLDVSTLSLTTSAVCAGFGCLGGAAIHEAVGKPDHIYRYRNADLLASLSGNKSS